MRRGAPARTTKAKARIKRYGDLTRAEPAVLPVELVYEIPPGPRLGARVLQVTGVEKSYDGRVVVPALDLELGPGTRLGIVGPNGAGKTTLLKLLLGELEPDRGERSVGETVRFMGIDQTRSALDPDLSVAETIAGRGAVVKVGERTVRLESFLDKWGFPARTHQTPIGRLSGGERGRVLLAQLLSAGGNVLFLDEPTNDLDLPTLRALEEALLAFPGSVVVVSHDRWFLDRVATQILYLDGQGGSRLHHGDVSGLLELLGAQRSAAPTIKPRATTRTPAPAKPAAAKRITPWQRKELEGIERRIAEIEGGIASIDERLADPALYAGPRTEIDAIGADRAALEEELASLYGRWEELETLPR
jgi:ATP-binding cassette subfamily F protein uup